MVQCRLCEPGTNTGWSAWVNEAAIFRPALPTSSRLSGEMLRHSFYIGTWPNTATLSIAATQRRDGGAKDGSSSEVCVQKESAGKAGMREKG